MNVRLLKKYFPDIVFLAGVWIISYTILIPPEIGRRLLNAPTVSNKLQGIKLVPKYEYVYSFYYEHSIGIKILGIILIALAFDIAIRRFILIWKK